MMADVTLRIEAGTKDFRSLSLFSYETSCLCEHEPHCMICLQGQLTCKCKFWYSSVAEDKFKKNEVMSEPESLQESLSAVGA